MINHIDSIINNKFRKYTNHMELKIFSVFCFLLCSCYWEENTCTKNFISSPSKPLAGSRLRAGITITSTIITFPAWYLHCVVTGCYKWSAIIRKRSHGNRALAKVCNPKRYLQILRLNNVRYCDKWRKNREKWLNRMKWRNSVIIYDLSAAVHTNTKLRCTRKI